MSIEDGGSGEFRENVPYPANGTVLQPDLNPMRMRRGAGQNLLDNTACQLTRALIFFLYDLHLKPFGNIFSILSVHTF